MDCLRYAGLSASRQHSLFLQIIWADPLLRDVLQTAPSLTLPDWWVVSGALYNTVWNHLTGRPSGYGIKDIDLFYFDDGDLTWEAEDEVIRRGQRLFNDCAKPVEIRNQARVHLWFERRFGQRCERLHSCRQSIGRFASRTHAVGVRLAETGELELYAPFGLHDIFALRLTPNPVLDNRATYEAKAVRAQATWPELSVVPW